MGDVQSAGGSVEQPKLSQGAAASPPQVKKRPSVRSRSRIQAYSISTDRRDHDDTARESCL